MPIPPFDSNSVLPPHTGDPRQIGQLSPYPCTTLEICQRFATTPERIVILDGLLRFRALLATAGFHQGFQWLDGSFLEDVEALENRPPNDLDIVTFYASPSPNFNQQVATAHPILTQHDQTKQTYHLDHYFMDMIRNPVLTVEGSRYWALLFSHRRDGVWKGMLRVDLNTPSEDTNARAYLPGMP
jgi:hypothetical protein